MGPFRSQNSGLFLEGKIIYFSGQIVQTGPFIWTFLLVLMLGTIIPAISCYVMFKIAHYRNTLPGKQSTIYSGVNKLC